MKYVVPSYGIFSLRLIDWRDQHMYSRCVTYSCKKLFISFVANLVFINVYQLYTNTLFILPPATLLFFYAQASLNWGKKDEPVYVTEESGVVGLNFHQSKEVLIHDSTNGIANHYDVRDYTPVHISRQTKSI
jgi:hypothetical protein